MLESAWGYLPLRLQGRGAPSDPGQQSTQTGHESVGNKINTGKGEATVHKDVRAKEGGSSWANTLTGGLLERNDDSPKN